MLWNLSSFEDLQPTVTQEYSPSGRRPREGRPITISFRVGFAVALVTATISVGNVVGSSRVLTVPTEAVTKPAANAERQRPPLSSFFDGQFDQDWTPSVEEDLLSKVAVNCLHGKIAPEQDPAEAIYSNQQESLLNDVPRLSKEQIRNIIKHKRPA
jgi:hypothetical protein